MRRTANTRAAVEAAIDFSKGANREPWERYVSEMSGIIVSWRTGNLPTQQRATRETSVTEDSLEN
jgi:hypothetical protein